MNDEDSIHPDHTLNKKEKRALRHELFIERMWRIFDYLFYIFFPCFSFGIFAALYLH